MFSSSETRRNKICTRQMILSARRYLTVMNVQLQASQLAEPCFSENWRPFQIEACFSLMKYWCVRWYAIDEEGMLKLPWDWWERCKGYAYDYPQKKKWDITIKLLTQENGSVVRFELYCSWECNYIDPSFVHPTDLLYLKGNIRMYNPSWVVRLVLDGVMDCIE